MKNYKKYLINKLLDSYENSVIYKGTSTLNRNIEFKFNKKSIKEYFDETSYEEKANIDEVCKALEGNDFIKIQWGNGYKSHLIEKIILSLNNIDDIYKEISREKKSNKEEAVIAILEKYTAEEGVAQEFSFHMITLLQKKESVKTYLDIDNLKEVQDILLGLKGILNQKDEIFKRILSMRLYGDSKRLEAIQGKILKIIKHYYPDESDINLSEFNVLDNYSYVYFKGEIILNQKESSFDISKFQGGIAISSKDIEEIGILNISGKSIITIENLTTFNSYVPKNEVAIYLGGYHNSIRRNLLKKIYKAYPKLNYYHWGDIDAGGLKILMHLRNKTEIPFKAFKMDINTLKEYKDYTKDLTTNDIKTLKDMRENECFKEFSNVIDYMRENKIKLEQEIITNI